MSGMSLALEAIMIILATLVAIGTVATLHTFYTWAKRARAYTKRVAYHLRQRRANRPRKLRNADAIAALAQATYALAQAQAAIAVLQARKDRNA